jgi:hypothetical protein
LWLLVANLANLAEPRLRTAYDRLVDVEAEQ